MAARSGAEALYRHKLSSLATAESTLHCIEASLSACCAAIIRRYPPLRCVLAFAAARLG